MSGSESRGCDSCYGFTLNSRAQDRSQEKGFWSSCPSWHQPISSASPGISGQLFGVKAGAEGRAAEAAAGLGQQQELAGHEAQTWHSRSSLQRNPGAPNSVRKGS